MAYTRRTPTRGDTENAMNSITHPAAIRAVALHARIRAVRMEQGGLKRRGQSLSAQLKEHYGLSKRASYEDLLFTLEQDLAAADAEFRESQS